MAHNIKRLTCALAMGLALGLGLQFQLAEAKNAKSDSVDCDQGDSIQAAVDKSTGPATIFISGNCTEDVVVLKDDITLSGNEAGLVCNKADPSASAGAEIDGTITIDGVRVRVEHLAVTGSGVGINIINRADARLFCNDVFDNQGTGIIVLRSSNAVLTANTVRGNGRQSFNAPFIFFDLGLWAAEAASVLSNGNTYENNQYAAIEIDRGATFRNGHFLPRTGGFPPDPNERDVIIQKGGDFSNPASCKTSSGGPVAVEVFNGGYVILRNADVCGEIEVTANSSLRVDDRAEIVGNVLNTIGSVVRMVDRSSLGDGRLTTFDGTLSCADTSQTYFSDVQCGETCTGPLSSCAP